MKLTSLQIEDIEKQYNKILDDRNKKIQEEFSKNKKILTRFLINSIPEIDRDELDKSINREDDGDATIEIENVLVLCSNGYVMGRKLGGNFRNYSHLDNKSDLAKLIYS